MSKVLIVVDVQKDFCEGGSLAVQGGAAVAAAITEYFDTDSDYDWIITTRDFHIDPGPHWSTNPDFVDSWPVHCKVGTEGVEYHDDLNVSVATFEVLKGQYAPSYSGFDGAVNNGPHLHELLQFIDVDEVDVCGLALDYCVKATALDAQVLGYKTRVLLNLTAAVHPENTDALIQQFTNRGIEVVL